MRPNYWRHFPRQVVALGTMLRSLFTSWWPRPEPAEGVQHTQGPVVHERSAMPSRALIVDFLGELGRRAERIDGQLVPPHLFPQWTYTVAARTLRTVGYSAARILNAGCALTIHRQLSTEGRLHIRGQLTRVDRNPRRAVFEQSIWTGSETTPDAYSIVLSAVVPLRSGRRKASERPSPSFAPEPGATAIHDVELDRGSGLRFALLTGDFNPIHWWPLYARWFGFSGPILQGFATFAHCFEGLSQQGPITRLDLRFVRPLTLPNRLRVYRDASTVQVVDGMGELVAHGAFES